MSGPRPSLDPELVATVLEMASELAEQWVYEDRKGTVTEVIDETAKLVWASLPALSRVAPREDVSAAALAAFREVATKSDPVPTLLWAAADAVRSGAGRRGSLRVA